MALARVEAALYTKLAATSALTALVSTRIYAMQAPASATYPLVMFYPASEIVRNDSPRVATSHVFRIEAWSTASMKEATNIMDTVYNALHLGALTISGWSDYWISCERVQKFIEQEDARQYWRTVADYRIELSQNS